MDAPTYQQQAQPYGSVNAEANPNDFGAQVGAAQQNMGAGVGQAGERMWQLEQDQGTVWAYEATSKAFAGLQQNFRGQVNSLDPNDPQFSDKVGKLSSDLNDQIDQQVQDLQNSAPSHSAARIVAKLAAFNSRSLVQYGMSEQARLSGVYTGKLVDDGMKSDQDSIASDPSDQNFARVLTQREAMIGSLNTVDPVMKMRWQAQLQHDLGVTQVQTLAAKNPQAFLATMGAQGGVTTIRGTTRGAVPGGPSFSLPQDFGADTVKPYTVQRVQQLADLTNKPSQYDSIINAAAAKFGVSAQDLKMRLAAESGLQAGVVGPQTPNGQSIGIAQITRENAAKAGINAFDPTQAIPWAAQQLSQYQQSAKGDAGTVDKLYYGGTDQAQWGPNTNQYAANLAAVRTVLNGTPAAGSDVPQVQPLTDAQIDTAKPQIAGWAHLAWNEKVAAVRQAEAAMGGQLASDRGTTELGLRDATATLLAGKDYPGLNNGQFSQQNLTRLYGPDEGQRKFDSLQYAQQVGGFMQHIATMPTAQAQATLSHLEPQGGPEFAAQQPMYKAALEAYARLDKERTNDFQQFAQDNGIAGAKPLDYSSSDALRDSLHSRLAVAAVGARDYGVPAHMLSQNEVDTLTGSLGNMNPAQQLNTIKVMREATQGHDDMYRDMLGQIFPKNTMFAQAAAVSMHGGSVTTAAGPQSGDQVGQYIIEGTHILQGKDVDDPQHTGRPMAFKEDQFRTAFWQTVGPNAFQSNDAQRSSQVANDTYQAVKNYVAADMYHRGMDPNSANYSTLVKNGVQAVTGGTTSVNGNQVFVPWGMGEDQFRRQWPAQAQAAIDAAGLKGGPLDKLDAYKPINLDDGKYGLMNGNKMLVGKDGRTVVVNFNSGATNTTPNPFSSVSADGHVATGSVH